MEEEHLVKLRVYNLHWLPHMPEQHDLCAHGAVEVEIAGETFEKDDEADLCVSAGALFLLRTLLADHTPSSPIGEQLIPHCGHIMYAIVGEQDVEIENCSTGVDWEVQHVGDQVCVRAPSEKEEYISIHEWQQIVFRFADTVELFYTRSQEKEPQNKYDASAYAMFRAEWSRRREEQLLDG